MAPTVAQAWYDLSHAFGTPLSEGIIRQTPEDFLVSERLSFEPTGSGEHTLVELEKRDANTQWVAKKLAAYCDVPIRDVGFAGLKDRHAITTQWFSVLIGPRRKEPDWASFSSEGVKLLSWMKHNRKLRRGALSSNSFKIRVVDIRGDVEEVRARCAHVAQEGVPNYFGLQRFGNNGSNLTGAWSWFEGSAKPKGRAQRGFYLSAARSFLFNRILTQRVMDHSWNSLLSGDVATLSGSNSRFLVANLDDELLSRVLKFDISASGALWGAGDLSSEGAVNELEWTAVKGFPHYVNGLTDNGLRQERRTLRVRPEAFRIEVIDQTAMLEFELPPGAFATAVLREIVCVP